MNNAQRVVRRLIEDVEDDFDVKDDLLRSDLTGHELEAHWHLLPTAKGSSYLTYKNRYIGYYVAVMWDPGIDMFGSFVYASDGSLRHVEHFTLPGTTTTEPAYAASRALELATLWLKYGANDLWQRAQGLI